MQLSERDAFSILGIKGYLVSPSELDEAYRRALALYVAQDPKGLEPIRLISRAYEILIEDDVEEEPRIYVVCAASYYQGSLHGLWLDPTQAPEVMEAQIAHMISESPTAYAHDWEIHSTQGLGYKGTFQDDLKTLHEKACFISEHGVLGMKLIERYGDVQKAHYIWDEHYHGSYESPRAFTEDLYGDAFSHDSFMEHHTHRRSLLEQLNHSIDYEALGFRLFAGDYYGIKLEDGLHVFRDI